MRLIGMLDSPFVRRVAVSMNFLGLPFEHEALSVFRGYQQFAAINPIVKAPTLVTDDGTMLVDSTLIIDYLEGLVAPERSLVNFTSEDRAYGYRLISLGVAACEKAVQLVYERDLRPKDRQLESWETRVIEQLRAAVDLMERSLPTAKGWLFGDGPRQPEISIAIAWRFIQEKHPGLLDAETYPCLAALSARCEALPEFIASPYDEG